MIFNLLLQLIVHILFALDLAIEIPITVIIWLFTGKKIGVLDGKDNAFMRFMEFIPNYINNLINKDK